MATFNVIAVEGNFFGKSFVFSTYEKIAEIEPFWPMSADQITSKLQMMSILQCAERLEMKIVDDGYHFVYCDGNNPILAVSYKNALN